MFGHNENSLSVLFQTPISADSKSYYQVPKYQRKYVWEKEKQVSRLIDDVFDNIGKPYFMGSLILCTSPNPIDSHSVELIDGQQRLTTFAIFIRALIDYIVMRKEDPSFPKNLWDKITKIQFQLSDKIEKNTVLKIEPVIRLSPRIHKFFRDELIVGDNKERINRLKKIKKGKHDSEIKLIDAYIKIWERIETEFGSYKEQILIDKLQNLTDSILDEKVFLVVTVHDKSDAYTVFETINGTAKPLTLSDLVRNLFFEKIDDPTVKFDPNDIEVFENDWDDKEQCVSDFASFIWHSYVSRFDTCGKNDLFKNLQILTKEIKCEEAFDLATDLIFKDATYYHIYENPNKERSDEKRRYLEMLQIMDATRCFPLLLSLDNSQENNIISEKNALDFLRILTSLTFWYSGICNWDAKKLESKYHSLARRIRKSSKANANEILNSMLSELYVEFPTRDICKSNFCGRHTVNSFIKMILYNIEITEHPKAEYKLKDTSKVQLEHILPKKPNCSWENIFKKEELPEYINKIGNCTLLYGPLNKDARNISFLEKLKYYKKSHISLTQELLSFDKWNASSINTRTLNLFELAQKIWPIYPQKDV